MMKPIFLSLFFLSSFAASPARAALFCGMRRNVACLIEAINEGRSSRVVKNLQAGVDPNGEEDGVTPIAAAIKAKNLAIVSELLKYRINLKKNACASGNALFCALDRFPPAVEPLLRAGANPNATNERGDLLLTVAVMKGTTLNYLSARTLLKHGADVNRCGENGNTPLATVLRRGGSADAMRFLLKNGADPNVLVNKKTPLFAYALLEAKSAKKALLLKKFRAKVDGRDSNGRTALIRELENGGNADTVAFLIKNGADVNARSADRQTPLIAAVKAKASDSVLNKLIAAGADVNAADADGNSAVAYTVKTRETVTRKLNRLDLLRKHGADMSAVSGKGETIADFLRAENKNVITDERYWELLKKVSAGK